MGVERPKRLILRAQLCDSKEENSSSLLHTINSGQRLFIQTFATPVDVAIAQSLFTHLPPSLIGLCLKKLQPCLKPDGRFFATFFEVEQERENPSDPHDHGYFAYTRQQMEAFGSDQGYQVDYIGDWGHPRNQVMVVYRHPDY